VPKLAVELRKCFTMAKMKQGIKKQMRKMTWLIFRGLAFAGIYIHEN